MLVFVNLELLVACSKLSFEVNCLTQWVDSFLYSNYSLKLIFLNLLCSNCKATINLLIDVQAYITTTSFTRVVLCSSFFTETEFAATAALVSRILCCFKVSFI